MSYVIEQTAKPGVYLDGIRERDEPLPDGVHVHLVKITKPERKHHKVGDYHIMYEYDTPEAERAHLMQRHLLFSDH